MSRYCLVILLFLTASVSLLAQQDTTETEYVQIIEDWKYHRWRASAGLGLQLVSAELDQIGPRAELLQLRSGASFSPYLSGQYLITQRLGFIMAVDIGLRAADINDSYDQEIRDRFEQDYFVTSESNADLPGIVSTTVIEGGLSYWFPVGEFDFELGATIGSMEILGYTNSYRLKQRGGHEVIALNYVMGGEYVEPFIYGMNGRLSRTFSGQWDAFAHLSTRYATLDFYTSEKQSSSVAGESESSRRYRTGVLLTTLHFGLGYVF